MSSGALPFDPTATPLAVAAAWMLQRYIDGELTVAQASDPARVYPADTADLRRLAFDGFRRPIRDVRGYEEVDDFVARIRVTDDRGRPMIVLVLQHPQHPGKVWQSAMILDPPDVTVRAARPDDAAALRALEAATPVQHDGFLVAYDRPDPFAQDRLRPLPTLRCVAEIDGDVVGTLADALHVLVFDGNSLPVSYVHHSRVRPDHQGKGIMPALNGFNWAPVMRDGSHAARVHVHGARQRQGSSMVVARRPSGGRHRMGDCQSRGTRSNARRSQAMRILATGARPTRVTSTI